MDTALPMSNVSNGHVIAIAISIGFVVLWPLVLGWIASRQLGVSWRYFGFGAIIFLLFQMLSRVPIVLFAESAIAPQVQASPGFTFGWLVLLSLTAGLFEEIGRYIGYRWWMGPEEKTWNKAVMYGLGHGGLESLLLVGGLMALSLVNVLTINPSNLATLPPEQQAAIAQQLTAFNSQPVWVSLLSIWERFWAIAVHVGLSVLVLQVFRQGNLGWLGLAILAHTLVNLVSLAVPQLLALQGVSALLLTQAIVAVFGLLGLWVIWTYREPVVDAS